MNNKNNSPLFHAMIPYDDYQKNHYMNLEITKQFVACFLKLLMLYLDFMLISL